VSTPSPNIFLDQFIALAEKHHVRNVVITYEDPDSAEYVHLHGPETDQFWLGGAIMAAEQKWRFEENQRLLKMSKRRE
jgi:hypothetical protein